MNPNMNTHILAIGPLGTWEMIVIAVLILVLFGAKKLPTFARSLGRSMGEFRRAKEDFEQELHRAQDDAERPTIKPEAAAKTVERQRDHEEV
jgi:sec-independent protein translocase protein TatA